MRRGRGGWWRSRAEGDRSVIDKANKNQKAKGREGEKTMSDGRQRIRKGNEYMREKRRRKVWGKREREIEKNERERRGM